MIFSKDKKNSIVEPKNSPSVEESAISRWKSLNQGGTNPESIKSTENSEIPKTKLEPRKASYLNALMKDGPIDHATVVETDRAIKSHTVEEIPERIQPSLFKKDEAQRLDASVLSLETIHYDQPTADQAIANEPIALVKPEVSKPKTPIADFSKNLDDDLANRFGSNLKSALGEGTMIDGTFSFETPVKVDGSLSGEIKSESALIVGKKARIKARVKVGSLIVLGTVEGEIEAEDLVEIRASGSVSGDIIAKRISLEEGGLFNGTCTILD